MTTNQNREIVFSDLNVGVINHDDIRSLLRTYADEFGYTTLTPTGNRPHNQSNLVWILNHHHYHGNCDYDSIRSWLDGLVSQRRRQREQDALLQQEEDMIMSIPAIDGPVQKSHDERKQLYDEIESILNVPSSNTPVQKPHDERKRLYDYVQALLNTSSSNGPVQKSHDERKQLYDEAQAILRIPASNGPVQKPHDERKARYDEMHTFEDYYEERVPIDDNTDEIEKLEQLRSEIDDKIKELQAAEQEEISNYTQGMLNGDYDFINNNNPELVKYIKEHPFKYIDDSGDAIMLFPPIDERLFKIALYAHHSKKSNQVTVKDERPVFNYYINNCTDMMYVFKLLDRIYSERAKPFKISYDCGYIVEDTKNVKYTRTPPTISELGRSIPTMIENENDLNTYKHYIYSSVCDRMSLIHKTSAHHYIAIHTFLFQVSVVSKSGAAYASIPGYEFLLRNKYIVDTDTKYDTCMSATTFIYLKRNGLLH